MKYMIEYKVRNAGLSHDQNLDNIEALLKVFCKWTPEDGLGSPRIRRQPEQRRRRAC